MNLRQLRIFTEVCKYESFTKASKALYMTQPAISHVIHDLENEVGTALFERTPKNTKVTPAGCLLLEKARTLLSIYDDLEKEIGTLGQRVLRIGSCITIAHLFLVDLISMIKEEYPELELSVHVASASAILAKLENNEIDMALIEGAFPQDKFYAVELSSYAILPVCSPNFISTSSLTIQELIMQPLLLREKGSAIRDLLDSTLLLHNVQVEPLWCSVNSNVLMKAAIHGMGIAYLPETMISDKVKTGALKIIEIENLTLSNDTYLIYNKYKQLTEPMQVMIEKAKLKVNLTNE